MTKAQVAADAARAPREKRAKELTPLDLLKMEIATELGLAVKVATEGWANLTAAESGRLGGLLHKRLKDRRISIGPRGTLLPYEPHF